MLCDVCQSMDFDTSNSLNLNLNYSARYEYWPKHHSLFQDLQKAAKDGCELCRLILPHAFPRRPGSSWGFIESDHPEQISYRTSGAEGNDSAGGDRINFKQNFKGIENTLGFNLGVFARPDSLAAKDRVVGGRPVEERPDSEGCFNLVRTWLEECLAEHGDTCHVTPGASLPTRVIDVGSEDGSRLPRVFVTDGKPGVWLTLSHCWGTQVRFVSDSTNLEERMEGFPMDLLPKTFSDAITVTRSLGFQFLWIDSLCILQDSYDDWTVESSKMQEYYKHSMLTIAPDDASGDEKGFLDDIRPNDGPILTIPFRMKSDENGLTGVKIKPVQGEYVYLRNRIEGYTQMTNRSCLSKRGWTLQEDLLSPRTVHYSSPQLHWECQKHRRSEHTGSPVEMGSSDNLETRTKHSFLRGPTNPVLRGAWFEIVSEYMRRSLTKCEDKLPALSGLAREVNQQTGFMYQAGIWLEDFQRGLLWIAYEYGERGDTYLAPSWSWASMAKLGGEPFHIGQFNGKQLERLSDMSAELLGCEVRLKGEDPFGQVTSGQITLRSLFLQLSDWKSDCDIRITSANWVSGFQLKQPHVQVNWNERTKQLDFDIQVKHLLICHFDETPTHLDWRPDDMIVRSNAPILQNLFLFHISNFATHTRGGGYRGAYLLILARAATEGHFRRVGIAHTHLDTFKSLVSSNGVETKDVIII